MSARQDMLNSAIKGMVEDFDDDIQDVSKRAKLENKSYIMKSNNHLPFITCYMCGNKDCEEIKYGNSKQASIYTMDLCKDCQRKMALFLLENVERE